QYGLALRKEKPATRCGITSESSSTSAQATAQECSCCWSSRYPRRASNDATRTKGLTARRVRRADLGCNGLRRMRVGAVVVRHRRERGDLRSRFRAPVASGLRSRIEGLRGGPQERRLHGRRRWLRFRKPPCPGEKGG